MDWTTEVAIRILAYLGAQDALLAPDIYDGFQTLLEHRPDGGHCCWERTLYEHGLWLPHLYNNEKQGLRKELERAGAQARGG